MERIRIPDLPQKNLAAKTDTSQHITNVLFVQTLPITNALVFV